MKVRKSQFEQKISIVVVVFVVIVVVAIAAITGTKSKSSIRLLGRHFNNVVILESLPKHCFEVFTRPHVYSHSENEDCHATETCKKV